MQAGEPSRTALAAAAHRAAHQILEGGRIFADPLALPILGQPTEDIRRDAEAHPDRRAMRIFIAARARFAEDALALAVARGTRQVVVLGAGLDTFAYRCPFEGVRIFEVDHPATQAWKRRRLAECGVAAPANLAFAPVDFERHRLADGLAVAGFDPRQRTFFSWLGVVPYLTDEAIWSTLGFMASLSGGAEVVFDYSDPPDARPAEARAIHARRSARVAALGEAWVTYFEPEPLRGRLQGMGFVEVEDLGPADIVARFVPKAAGPGRERGGHLLRAATG